MTGVDTAAVAPALPDKGMKPRGKGAEPDNGFADALQAGSDSLAATEMPPADSVSSSWPDLMTKLNAVLNGAGNLSGETPGTLLLRKASQDQEPEASAEATDPADTTDLANAVEQTEPALQQPDAQADAVLSVAELPSQGTGAIVFAPGKASEPEDGAETAEESLIRAAPVPDAKGQSSRIPVGASAVNAASGELPVRRNEALLAEAEPNRPENARQVQKALWSGTPAPEQSSEGAKQISFSGSQSAPNVTILSTQNIPAPLATDTTARFIQDIGSSSGLATAAAARAGQVHDHLQPRQTALQTLKIQLNPAELGTVTANLRLSGEQMQVELRVESSEAYHRLSKDAEMIVKAFRAMGYDIDQVSVQQSSSSQGSQRLDAGTSGSQSFSQEPSSSHAGMSRNGSRGGGNQGFESEVGVERLDGQASVNQDGPSRGLYI